MYDAVAAIDSCKPLRFSLNLPLVSVRDRLAHGILRRMHWVDARDVPADGPTKGEIDRILLHRASNGCPFELARQALTHANISAGSATKPIDDDGS